MLNHIISRFSLTAGYLRVGLALLSLVALALGGSAGGRGTDACGHGAGKHDPAPKQRAAIEEAIAGGRRRRRSSRFAIAHASSPYCSRLFAALIGGI